MPAPRRSITSVFMSGLRTGSTGGEPFRHVDGRHLRQEPAAESEGGADHREDELPADAVVDGQVVAVDHGEEQDGANDDPDDHLGGSANPGAADVDSIRMRASPRVASASRDSSAGEVTGFEP